MSSPALQPALTQQPTTGRSSGAMFASAASATRLTSAVAWAGRSPSAFAICFGALPRIGPAVTVSGWLESLFTHEYDRGLRALLHRLYAATAPVPLSDLYEVVWHTVSPLYVLDDLSPDRLGHLRTANDHDVQRVLKVLASLGAVHLTEDTAKLTADGRIETARMRGEPEPGDAVLRILVELADVDDPRVWRQLLVPASIRLDRLHSVIQDAMGWQNCHMHAFTDYTATRRTLSPQSFVMSSMSEVSMTTGRR
jgi:hypothetical protein